MNFSKIKLINAQEELLIISDLLSVVNVEFIYLFIFYFILFLGGGIHGPL
jgi:hypothetical protein